MRLRGHSVPSLIGPTTLRLDSQLIIVNTLSTVRWRVGRIAFDTLLTITDRTGIL